MDTLEPPARRLRDKIKEILSLSIGFLRREIIEKENSRGAWEPAKRNDNLINEFSTPITEHLHYERWTRRSNYTKGFKMKIRPYTDTQLPTTLLRTFVEEQKYPSSTIYAETLDNFDEKLLSMAYTMSSKLGEYEDIKLLKKVCESKEQCIKGLDKACKRLKKEEKGFEAYVNKDCEEVIDYLLRFGGYVRPRIFRTADNDYDVVIPRGRQQAHFRLRKVGDCGCLVTVHIEPTDPFWHIACGLADKVSGEERKPAECIPFYMDVDNVIKLLEDAKRSREDLSFIKSFYS